MKVTKVGKIPSGRLWVGRCSNCNSEAEAMEEELTHITYNLRGNRFSWEKCPVCGNSEDTSHGSMCFYPAKNYYKSY